MTDSFKNFKQAIDEELIKDRTLKNIIEFCFIDDKATEVFIRKCLKKKKTRWMLNRLHWFIELADYQKYDSVKLFFLIAIAEVLVKLSEKRFKKNELETQDVKKFFRNFPLCDKQILRKCFFKSDKFLRSHNLKFTTIVNVLLNVRHKLAHGKSHYDFSFHSGQKDLWNPVWGEIGSKKKKRAIHYELTLTYEEFRKIMIKNAISLIQKNL